MNHILDLYREDFSDIQTDVNNGFSQNNKSIPAKYHYDEKGSELFNQITHHLDYYLTSCEMNALFRHTHRLLDIFQSSSFNLIELGPGEGIKTDLMMSSFLNASMHFRYIPIDLSYVYLNHMISKLKQKNIQILPIHGDYFDSLKWVTLDSEQANLVLFLGSSIGNYNVPEREQFLILLHDSLNHGDYVLIGFDLIKNPKKMLKAYDDSAGITREFNLNVLRRMNKELNANFNIENFQYIPIFNHHTQAIESYLISLKNQLINIEALQKEFYLKKHEKIHMENSHKFYIPQIHHMAQQSGFRVIDDFLDEQGYFVDSLWQVT